MDQNEAEKAEELLKAAWNCTDSHEYDRLVQQAAELLIPLVEQGVPLAQYLYAGIIRQRDGNKTQYYKLMNDAAGAGYPKAQFVIGQGYDDDEELGRDAVKSAHFFRLSAEQGYPYAQWVHGLNLLNGNGIEEDAELGLKFIGLAAEGKFEGAVEFLADAYADGSYGFPKDESLASHWRSKLCDPDIIGFIAM